MKPGETFLHNSWERLSAPEEIERPLPEVSVADLSRKVAEMGNKLDLSKILSAFEFAQTAHAGQTRQSGEPYVIHPLSVAIILIELGMDTDTVCTGLLHDVVEDTAYTQDDIRHMFGQSVADMVAGVTKIQKSDILKQNPAVLNKVMTPEDKEFVQATNVMKIFNAMARDPRVIIVKLADRLHNMLTLKYLRPEKQRRIAYETLNIYVTIAERFGIYLIKDALEDLAFYYIEPFAYSEIENLLDANKQDREAFIQRIKAKITERLEIMVADGRIQPDYEVQGRVKSMYGLYRKLYVNHTPWERIYDKYAVRVIVHEMGECWLVIGEMQILFPDFLDRNKNWLGNKRKANGYESYHMTMFEEATAFEIQIRTRAMHEVAEYGLAAHWKYKEGIKGKDSTEKLMSWVRHILESQQSADDVGEIFEAVKEEKLDHVTAVTPKGKAVELPIGATVLDFAYAIHTDVGNNTLRTMVDGHIVPFDYVLQDGEVCEIVTTNDSNRGPNREWLGIVKTNSARSKIRAWLKREKREENIVIGRGRLVSVMERAHIDLPEEKWSELFAPLMKRHNCATLEDFFASIGYGGISLEKIKPDIFRNYQMLFSGEPAAPKPHREKYSIESSNAIIIDGIDDVKYHMAKCCHPWPGDDAVAYTTRGSGIAIHKKNCKNYLRDLEHGDAEKIARWRNVVWSDELRIPHRAVIELLIPDRIGLISEVGKITEQEGVNVESSSSRTLPNGNCLYKLNIIVQDDAVTKRLLEKLKKLRGTISVSQISV